MSAVYFGGTPDNMGRVVALAPTDFQSLVDDLISHPVAIGMTQEELLALPEKKQNAAKRTDYLVPCAFKSNPSPRKTGEATVAHLLCLDIDDGAEGRRLLKTGFEKALGDLNAVVWHTARSTPAKPRLRIVVPTLPVPVGRYAMAVTAIAGLLGMNTLNHESKVPVQPMYLPVQYKDATVDPIAYLKTDGRDFDPSDLEGLEDLAKTNDGATPEADMGDIEYLRAPVEGVTKEEIVDALERVPATCSMQQWIEVGMALKHQFGEAGFAVWDDWSASAPDKYPGMEVLAKRWESMKANPGDRVPVTIRTVLRTAVEAGWNNRPMATRIFDQARDWIRSDARSSEELLDQGAKRIAKLTSVIGPIETKVLIADLHSTVKSRGLRGPTQQDLAKEVGRLTAAATRAASVQPPWASNVVFLTALNMFYRPLDHRKMKREVVDLIHKAPVPDVPASAYLIHDIGIPVVENLRYDPSQRKRVFVADGVPYINTYRATYPKADRAMEAEALDLATVHLKNVMGPRYWTLGMNIFAYLVQQPGRKIRWALFLQSAPGAGKGAIAHMGQIVLGSSNVQRVAAEHVAEGAHNGWASGFQLSICDEVRFASYRQAHRIMDKFKPIISDDMISVRQLYEPVVTVPNTMNWMLFSNYHDALPISLNDRRYCVVASPLQTKEQVLGLGDGYFDRLYSEMNRLGPGLRAAFENWRIPADFKPEGHAPVTDFLGEMAQLTTPPLQRALREVLEDEPHPLVRRDLVSMQALRNCMPREGLGHFTDQALAGLLREEGYVGIGRHLVDNAKHALYVRGAMESPAERARERMMLL